MRIGLMSDTHDRIPAIDALLRQMVAKEITFVLHAGDFCAPFSLKPFQDHGVAMAGIFGRNDGDPEGLRAAAAGAMGLELFESPHAMKVGEQKVLVVHDLADAVERSVLAHGIVVHGHTHEQGIETRGSTLLVNPGEACGWLYGVPSAAILDTETKSVEFIRLEGPEWKT